MYDAEELLCRHTIVFIMVNILYKDHYNIRGGSETSFWQSCLYVSLLDKDTFSMHELEVAN